MSFCATCGQPRKGTAPFCVSCGARFADAGDAADQPAKPESGSAETRWDTRIEMPGGHGPSAAAPTRPSAAFPPPPAAVPSADIPPTAVPFSPVPPGQGPYSGPVPPNQPGFGPQPPPRRGGSGLLIAMVIVLVFLVGGGAFALVSALTKNKAGAPSGQPTSGTSSPAASATGSASASASASPTTSPTGSTSTVAVSPSAAANQSAPQVQALVERYFSAINSHDYAAYNSIHDAKSQMARSTFDSGYATTTDSAEELTAISDAGGGELAATLTFVSHQDPAKSINNSSCTKWTIMLYLLPQGGSYLITSTPPGYHAAFAGC